MKENVNKEKETHSGVHTTIEKEKTELPMIYLDETVQEDWCKSKVTILRVSGKTSDEAYETFKKVRKDMK